MTAYLETQWTKSVQPAASQPASQHYQWRVYAFRLFAAQKRPLCVEIPIVGNWFRLRAERGNLLFSSLLGVKTWLSAKIGLWLGIVYYILVTSSPRKSQHIFKCPLLFLFLIMFYFIVSWRKSSNWGFNNATFMERNDRAHTRKRRVGLQNLIWIIGFFFFLPPSPSFFSYHWFVQVLHKKTHHTTFDIWQILGHPSGCYLHYPSRASSRFQIMITGRRSTLQCNHRICMQKDLSLTSHSGSSMGITFNFLLKLEPSLC